MRNPEKMKAIAEETERSGFESEKTETLGEKSETKKKVRVVKKIVKKKVIKKVPKRVPVASKCNDEEKVASPNPNDDSPMVIENPNPVIDDLKEDNNLKESKVSDMEVDVHLVKSSDSCRDESQVSGMVPSFRPGCQIQNDLQDSDQNQIELQDGDQNQMEVRGIVHYHGDQNQMEGPDTIQNQIESQDVDHNQIELQDNDQNQIDLLDGDQNQTEVQDSVQNQIELQDGDHNQIEMLDSAQNQIELLGTEHYSNTKNVEELDDEESVKELVVNSETVGLKSQEAVTEIKIPSGETAPSGSHIKQVTKIFIHGLVEDTKEGDIRKVFEDFSEVFEVKLITDPKTGKNRGFGFLSLASTDLAKTALANVEICGRRCHTAAIKGDYSILLSNIDRKWKIENVVELLDNIGIKNIDGVLVLQDPANTELNCGFAFLEIETKRDAQMAYHKLQNKNVLGVHSNIEVSQGSSFDDPVEEETHNIKSVYAENIPPSWDEKVVEDHFKTFGEIESVALAKNLRTAKRSDFAFINYKTYEAALSCIEALTSKMSTSNSNPKGQLKVSLAKSMRKFKPVKPISDSAVIDSSKVNQKPNQQRQSHNQYKKTYHSKQNLSVFGVYKPPQKPKIMIGGREDSRKDLQSSTTDELVQLLREQASWKHGGPAPTPDLHMSHHPHPSGGNQLFPEPGSNSLYHHDPRAYHQTHQIPNPAHHRPFANMASFTRYDQQSAHYTFGRGSFNVDKSDPRYFQIRDQTTYPGSSSSRRYQQMR